MEIYDLPPERPQDWTDLPDRELHPDELLVKDIIEQYHQDVARLVDYLKQSKSGRPLFTLLLSDFEKLQRFYDPLARAEIIKQIESTQGLAGVRAYYDEMISIGERLYAEAGAVQ